MAGFIAEMQELASELFTEFEAIDVTVTRTSPGSVSVSGVPTPGATRTNVTVGIFRPLTSYTDNREELITLAQRKMRYLIMSAKGMSMDPQPQDTIAIGSDIYRVESSTPINPNGSNGAAIAHHTLVVQL